MTERVEIELSYKKNDCISRLLDRIDSFAKLNDAVVAIDNSLSSEFGFS